MPIPSTQADPSRIQSELLRWYRRARRPLPWRRDNDPYRVLVSEFMLQQTRVDTVVPYFERWMRRFPTLDRLAEADVEDVLEVWAGLGYYTRARNLHHTAQIVQKRFASRIPDTVSALRELPGIGPYTAGAIASIAFGRAEAAVDGNVRRVLSRLYDRAAPTPRQLRDAAAALVPDSDPGVFNQAMMELGARVCTPREPACHACPLHTMCRARARGTVARRPARRRRRPIPTFVVGTAIMVHADRVVVARRRDRRLLGGMWEFPGLVAETDEPAEDAALRAASAVSGRHVRDLGKTARTGALAPIDHAFTHRRHIYRAFVFAPSEPLPLAPDRNEWSAAEWVSRRAVDQRALSAAQRRLLGAFDGIGAC